MQFNTVAFYAALLAAVEARIAFTTLPSTVKAGSPVKLGWEGSDGTPVTITLKQGEPNDLKTVALITGSASGNSFTWTPSTDLPSGSNYALQIAQDDTDINYTGLFTLTGGSSSSGSSSASASSGASASSESSVSKASTTTTAAPRGTASSGLVTGTGVSTARNTTLSRATLSSTRSSSTSSSAATTTSEEGAAATTSATASPTGGATMVASNFGLLVAGFAAVAYLL